MQSMMSARDLTPKKKYWLTRLKAILKLNVFFVKQELGSCSDHDLLLWWVWQDHDWLSIWQMSSSERASHRPQTLLSHDYDGLLSLHFWLCIRDIVLCILYRSLWLRDLSSSSEYSFSSYHTVFLYDGGRLYHSYVQSLGFFVLQTLMHGNISTIPKYSLAQNDFFLSSNILCDGCFLYDS